MRNVNLRVDIITETYPPEINGVANTLGYLSRELAARDYQIKVITPRHRDRESTLSNVAVEEVPGIRIPMYPELQFGLPVKNQLSSQWRNCKPDVVYIATEGPLGFAAISAAKKLGIPCVAGFHTRFDLYSEHYSLGWLQRPLQWYLKHFHNRCCSTLVPTEEMRDYLAHQGFDNVKVQSRGVDTQRFNPAKRNNSIRVALGLGEHDLLVLYVGRLAAEKNIDLAIEAFNTAAQTLSNVKMVVVGDGPLAADLKLRNPRLHFVGKQTGEDLAKYYASADIFLFPSLTETFGNVTLEAMASGLAVIAFAQAGAKQLIISGKNGILIPSGDRELFIAQSVDLMKNGALVKNIGKEARLTAEKQSWACIAADFADILHNCAAQGVA